MKIRETPVSVHTEARILGAVVSLGSIMNSLQHRRSDDYGCGNKEAR
jgi:hypothetical protein